MKSTRQARPKSTPLKVTLNIKVPTPMASGRITPTTKTAAKPCC